MQLLIVEDDAVVRDHLQRELIAAGHRADTAADGQIGLMHATSADYDVLIVDRLLPRLDGLALIQALRDRGDVTPVLILSALHRVDQRVQGLRSGGDDYLTKPFAFAELLGRVEVLARRPTVPASAPTRRLAVADLELDADAHTVTRAGQPIALQMREFQLLRHLLEHRGRVVTRAMLLAQVWDYDFDPQTNLIDVHISRLRRKIDRGFDRSLIRTVRGVGYIIDD